MAMISTNEFRPGLKVIIENELCEIVDNQFHKPGKGQAVMRVKYRSLITGRVLDKTFKTGESVDKADISTLNMQYLYKEANSAVFMDLNTYEQINFDLEVMGYKSLWIKEGETYEIALWEDTLVSVDIDTFVEIEIIETEPGFKGDTTTNTLKSAKLANGIEVKVPLFIDQGDVIKIDTRTNEYQSRAK
jgi:elongation factor P|tara:strand:- start:6341 stop:6907 length:567 start_codon:yes stop_codon:yes gene_type:complete